MGSRLFVLINLATEVDRATSLPSIGRPRLMARAPLFCRTGEWQPTGYAQRGVFVFRLIDLEPVEQRWLRAGSNLRRMQGVLFLFGMVKSVRAV